MGNTVFLMLYLMCWKVYSYINFVGQQQHNKHYVQFCVSQFSFFCFIFGKWQEKFLKPTEQKHKYSHISVYVFFFVKHSLNPYNMFGHSKIYTFLNLNNFMAMAIKNGKKNQSALNVKTNFMFYILFYFNVIFMIDN